MVTDGELSNVRVLVTLKMTFDLPDITWDDFIFTLLTDILVICSINVRDDMTFNL